MEDGESNDLTTAEKHDMLRKLHTARVTFPPNETDICPVPFHEARQWELCGDIAIFRDSAAMRVIQLSSPSRGLVGKSWEIKLDHLGSPFRIEEICVDPYQDLVVLLESPRDDMRKAIFLSLKTGQRHHLVVQNDIHFVLPHSRTGGALGQAYPKAQVSGDLLAVMFIVYDDSVGTDTSNFNVVNWKTGEQILSVRGWEHQTFAFLDDIHIVLGSKTMMMLQVIDVFSFTDTEDSPHSWNFQLPISSRVEVGNMDLTGSDIPPVKLLDRTKMHVASDPRILMLDLDIGGTGHDDSLTSFRLFFFPSTLLQHIERGVPDIHWDLWLPQACRILTGPFPSYAWSSVFGTRYITIERGEAVIYDFNPYAIHRTLSGSEVGSEVVTEASHTETPAYFVLIPSSLPYRKYRTGVPVNDQESVAITANGIAVYMDVDITNIIRFMSI